nr:unnamed protein product [Callosobruchus analis]
MTFKHKPSLDDHIVKRHPDFITSVSRKVHECTKCTYKTTSISDLSRHVLKLCQTATPHKFRKYAHYNATFRSKIELDSHTGNKDPDFIEPVTRKIHACTNCTYKAVSTSQLKQHMVKHSDAAGNNCMYCNKTFLNKRSLDDHIIRTHPDFIASVSSKIHVCTNCTYKAVSTSQLKRHMVKHSDNRNNCMYCNKTFLSKRSLDDHIIRTHPDFIASVSSQIHECTKCSYKTTLTKQLNIHMMKHPEGTFQCIYCNKTFTCKQSLDDHIVKIHPDFIASVSGTVHKCTKCTYKTVSTTQLKRHKIDGNRTFRRCIYCNKTFIRKRSLDDHIVKAHPEFIASVGSKVHECSRCTYKTILTSHLKGHNLAKHPDIAGCIYCNKTFTSKLSLDDHIVKKHPDFIASVSRKVHECSRCTYKTTFTSCLKGHIRAGNRVLIRCIYCKKTFTSKRSLEDHIVKTHPDFIASVSRKVHKCTKCSYKTVQTSKLKRHMAKHPDVANKCVYCNKVFVCKRSLDDHMVKNHPDFIASVSRKVHDCTKCTFKTVSASLSRRHMLNHPVVTVRCTYCNKTFKFKQALDDHIIEIHPDFIACVSRKVHECKKCTYKTVSTSLLKRHMVKHPDIADRCIYCNMIFVRKRALDDHIVRKHPDFIASASSKVHECTECTYKTISTTLLKQHMAKHLDTGVRCTYCNKTFKFKRALDDHIIEIHPDFIACVSRKVHECTKCTYKTVSTWLLKRHMVKHPDIAGNYITIRCMYCNKIFPRTLARDDHIVRKHPDFIASVSRKILECTKCTYKTVITTRLKQHTVKHSEPSHTCIYCNNTFRSQLTLDDHIVKRHPDFIESVTRKIHACTKCTFKTTRPSKLNTHMLSHVRRISSGNVHTVMQNSEVN